ncbi:hypothetical protein [Haloarchaeobius sp. DFWS5]|uniref:hypothetical protein n=1 Tax=Haloarchaeobius sp. DFWS5 TaxID=3446114 RepID=UPI003EBE58A8
MYRETTLTVSDKRRDRHDLDVEILPDDGRGYDAIVRIENDGRSYEFGVFENSQGRIADKLTSGDVPAWGENALRQLGLEGLA